MTSPKHPRFLQTAGLALLGALLVVASCEVEPPATTAVGPTDIEAGPAAVEAEPDVVEVTPPNVQEEPRADQAGDVEAVEAAITTAREEARAAVRALAEGPVVSRVTAVSEIEAEPVFTPMTVRPEIRNREEIRQTLMREYPALLRDAGIGGRVVVWFLISETGEVVESRLSETSGQVQLDAAALRVANVFGFTPALNRDEPVPVWIQLPITFQVN